MFLRIFLHKGLKIFQLLFAKILTWVVGGPWHRGLYASEPSESDCNVSLFVPKLTESRSENVRWVGSTVDRNGFPIPDEHWAVAFEYSEEEILYCEAFKGEDESLTSTCTTYTREQLSALNNYEGFLGQYRLSRKRVRDTQKKFRKCGWYDVLDGEGMNCFRWTERFSKTFGIPYMTLAKVLRDTGTRISLNCHESELGAAEGGHTPHNDIANAEELQNLKHCDAYKANFSLWPRTLAQYVGVPETLVVESVCSKMATSLKISDMDKDEAKSFLTTIQQRVEYDMLPVPAGKFQEAVHKQENYSQQVKWPYNVASDIEKAELDTVSVECNVCLVSPPNEFVCGRWKICGSVSDAGVGSSCMVWAHWAVTVEYSEKDVWYCEGYRSPHEKLNGRCHRLQRHDLNIPNLITIPLGTYDTVKSDVFAEICKNQHTLDYNLETQNCEMWAERFLRNLGATSEEIVAAMTTMRTKIEERDLAEPQESTPKCHVYHICTPLHSKPGLWLKATIETDNIYLSRVVQHWYLLFEYSRFDSWICEGVRDGKTLRGKVSFKPLISKSIQDQMEILVLNQALSKATILRAMEGLRDCSTYRLVVNNCQEWVNILLKRLNLRPPSMPTASEYQTYPEVRGDTVIRLPSPGYEPF